MLTIRSPYWAGDRVPYLSRVWLNPLRPRAQTFLRNPHVLHAAVLGGLSRQPVSERILWRLAPDSRHRVELLILTQSIPSWEHLVEQAGWGQSDEPQQTVRDYQPLLDKVQCGREFRFRLRANPVSSTRSPTAASQARRARLEVTGSRGMRVPHRTVAQQMTWLTQRIGRWGFDVLGSPESGLSINVVGRERLSFPKGSSSTMRVVLSTATYDGIVRIRDVDAARHRLLTGVGAGKAYGCGLITLAPYGGN